MPTKNEQAAYIILFSVALRSRADHPKLMRRVNRLLGLLRRIMPVDVDEIYIKKMLWSLVLEGCISEELSAGRQMRWYARLTRDGADALQVLRRKSRGYLAPIPAS